MSPLGPWGVGSWCFLLAMLGGTTAPYLFTAKIPAGVGSISADPRGTWQKSPRGNRCSKLLNKSELENLGYNLVIYPVTTQRLAMQNVENGLKSIFKDGHQNNILDKMQTRKRLYELVEYEKYNTPGKKITDFSTEGHE